MSEPHNETSTSRAAADSVRDIARADRERILLFVRSLGDYGAICDEVEATFGMPHQTASARLNQLQHERKLMVTCRTRKTSHGRQAFVYVATSLLCDADYLLVTKKRRR